MVGEDAFVEGHRSRRCGLGCGIVALESGAVMKRSEDWESRPWNYPHYVS